VTTVYIVGTSLEMGTTESIVEVTVRLVIIFFGIIGNLFIMGVYLLKYRRSKALQPTELIVTILAFFNVLIPINLVLPMIRGYFLCNYFGEASYKLVDVIVIFVSKASYWFLAWLCFFYCVQIIKVNWKLFLDLKRKISSVVKVLVFFTLLFCILMSIPVISIIQIQRNSSQVLGHCKNFYMKGNNVFIYGVVLTALTSLLPLVIMVVSSLSIVIFLCKHSRNMTRNVSTGGSSHSNAHTAVAIMLICLIILFIVCTFTVIFANLQVSSGEFNILAAISITSSLYSAGSAVILVIGTVKLRKSFKKL
uniref:Taste receptor type 2 n=1 Tax=Latimeria chalumnae TaxID=7897 RepID=H2ZSI0_LATCH